MTSAGHPKLYFLDVKIKQKNKLFPISVEKLISLERKGNFSCVENNYIFLKKVQNLKLKFSVNLVSKTREMTSFHFVDCQFRG